MGGTAETSESATVSVVLVVSVVPFWRGAHPTRRAVASTMQSERMLVPFYNSFTPLLPHRDNSSRRVWYTVGVTKKRKPELNARESAGKRNER